MSDTALNIGDTFVLKDGRWVTLKRFDGFLDHYVFLDPTPGHKWDRGGFTRTTRMERERFLRLIAEHHPRQEK